MYISVVQLPLTLKDYVILYLINTKLGVAEYGMKYAFIKIWG